MAPMPTDPTPAQPFRPTVVPEAKAAPLHVVVDQPGGRFGWRRRLLWMALGISVLVNVSLYGAYSSYFQPEGEVEEKYHSLSRTATDKVAVLSIEGTIMGGSDSFPKRQIDRIRDDEHVKAIVLRVDSPGGTVTGSDFIYHHLKKLAKDKQVPLVVSMGSMAASGGYYVAMAAGDKERIIFAEPTTWTGSIGVIIPHYDVSELLANWNVKDDSIASGPLKQMGSPTRKLSEDERAGERKVLQELVNDSFTGFKQIVLDNRSALRGRQEWQQKVFTGRIFTASQAKNYGLVDELGFVEDAINRAIELASLNKDEVRVIKYRKPLGIFDGILFSSSQLKGHPGFDLPALLDMTAPRAYYLCTWLPGLDLGSR